MRAEEGWGVLTAEVEQEVMVIPLLVAVQPQGGKVDGLDGVVGRYPLGEEAHEEGREEDVVHPKEEAAGCGGRG